MVEADKKQFWATLNLTMELCQAFPLTKEAVIVWYDKLKQYEMQTISSALDGWVDTQKKAPTPSDILALCKPKPDFYKAIGRVRDEEVDQEGLEKIGKFIADKTESKIDYHAWFKRILSRPSAFPDDSVAKAEKAALGFGYDLAQLRGKA